MSEKTKTIIKNTAKKEFSLGGIDQVSVRHIAEKCNISSSVIYHYWKSQDNLLKEIFTETRKNLGVKRKKLIVVIEPKSMLRQRVDFQFDNAVDVVFILKYYTHYRSTFKKNAEGYVPKKSYAHIVEVLESGVEIGEFANIELAKQAKIITHAINGFLLEYYPKIPKGSEKKLLVDDITNFIYRAILKGGEKL
jgi:AcrR family transcriptional regulator